MRIRDGFLPYSWDTPFSGVAKLKRVGAFAISAKITTIDSFFAEIIDNIGVEPGQIDADQTRQAFDYHGDMV